MPSAELVAITHAKTIQDLAFVADAEHPLTTERFLKIGQGPAYQRRAEFEASLQQQAHQSQIRVQDLIKAYDNDK